MRLATGFTARGTAGVLMKASDKGCMIGDADGESNEKFM
jgi:hypothetical protein